MARDFHALKRPVWRKGQRLAFVRHVGGQAGLVIGFLIFASLPTLVAVSPLGPSLAPIKRPPFTPRPCQTIDQATFNRGWTDAPRSFSFLGVGFARRRGDADCQGRKHFGGKTYWPVCEFDVPFQLAVTRGGRTDYYAVPGGFTATVEAKPDAPTRCYVTAYNTFPLHLSSEAKR